MYWACLLQALPLSEIKNIENVDLNFGGKGGSGGKEKLTSGFPDPQNLSLMWCMVTNRVTIHHISGE